MFSADKMNSDAIQVQVVIQRWVHTAKTTKTSQEPCHFFLPDLWSLTK